MQSFGANIRNIPTRPVFFSLIAMIVVSLSFVSLANSPDLEVRSFRTCDMFFRDRSRWPPFRSTSIGSLVAPASKIDASMPSELSRDATDSVA